MKRISVCIVPVFWAAVLAASHACTTAIVSGKVTPDGRPLLMKHRDTGTLENVMTYNESGLYAYIGLNNAGDTTQVWAGCNSAGFAIMNAASYNLNADTSSFRDREGEVMKQALQTCATLADFENMLRSMGLPLPVESNFGVIDAAGGAAYYETGNAGFIKIDVNDSRLAPFGYVVRTNYSATGAPDEGYGYIRFMTAEALFYEAAAMHDLTPRFMLQDVSRCLRHSLTKTDLKDLKPAAAEYFFVPFEDYIVRHSSSATVVVQGVHPQESPEFTILWTVLGWQPCGVALPLWVKGGEGIPEILRADASGEAPLCRTAMKMKEKAYPILRGSGTKYLNLPAVWNREGTGFWQRLKPLEDRILEETRVRMENWRRERMNTSRIREYYRWLNETVIRGYQSLGQNLKSRPECP